MRDVTSVASIRGLLAPHRRAARRIALVPTMGALHAGHLSLVAAARRRADVVVMSLFVNPLQFGPGEDFERYPRNLAHDRELAAGAGVELLFAPAAGELFGAGTEVRVTGGELASRWEGAARPGHFDGVLTIVAKLFNIVGPDVACFGQKDIQQATLVRRMVRELDMPVEVVVAPIVRDADGLAMSSRNRYLSTGGRTAALALPRALHRAREQWRTGETDAEALARSAHEVLAAEPGIAMDYIAIVDRDTLTPVARAVPGTVIAIAVHVGRTRLIDNVILGAAHGTRIE